MDASAAKSPPQPRERRLGVERRCFAYTGYIPERRSGIDRRSASPPKEDSGLVSVKPPVTLP
jgi:hypothetical protein